MSAQKFDPSPLICKMSALAYVLVRAVRADTCTQNVLVRADTRYISKNLKFFASKSAEVRI